MKKYLIIALTVITVLCSAAHAVVMDKIVAVVNEEVITQQELNEVLLPIFLKYRELYQGEDFEAKIQEAREAALNRIIEDKLILSEAKRLQITVTEEEVNERIADIEEQFESEEEFLEVLEKEGLTLPELHQRYHNQIMARRLIDYMVRAQVSVTPSEISRWYQEKLADFVEAPKLGLLNLLMRVSEDGNKGEAKEQAEKILVELKLGKTPGEIVEEYKESEFPLQLNDMGEVRLNDLAEEIKEYLVGLKAGDYSEVVDSGLGYHIFKIKHRSKGRTRDFTEAQDEIREELFRQKAEQRYQEWIEELKKNAYISIKEDISGDNDR